MSTTTIVLMVIAALLFVLVALKVIGLRKRQPIAIDFSITPQIEAAIDRLDAAANHHADVSAVVTMVRQLDADPDALELIKSYPATVQAGAWLHYINTLGADLQAAQSSLSRAHQGRETSFMVSQAQLIEQRQAAVDAVRVKLDAAVKASGQSGLRSI